MRFSSQPSDSEIETLEDVQECLKVLVVGRGAQEHALCWRLATSPSVQEVWAWPGNPGILRVARRAPVAAQEGEDLRRLADWAHEQRIDVAVVTNPTLLVHGAIDEFVRRGVPAFGPDSSAFRLESSKTWAKMLMEEAGIVAARGEFFADARHAKRYAQRLDGPWVVKADGITEGVGTSFCATLDETFEAIDANLKQRTHGVASRHIVVEEFVAGEEIQVQAITDGQALLLLPVSQRHARLLEGDLGPGTAGMGAHAPVRYATPDTLLQVQSDIFLPLLKKMDQRGVGFRGVLHASIRLSGGGARISGINARFADPDLQAIMPLFDGDLGRVIHAAARGTLRGRSFGVKPKQAAVVVLACEGYPRPTTRTGGTIEGLTERDMIGPERFLFYEGAALQGGRMLVDGGRVVSCAGVGDTLQQALEYAYAQAEAIHFDGRTFRRDIGQRALAVNSTQTKA